MSRPRPKTSEPLPCPNCGKALRRLNWVVMTGSWAQFTHSQGYGKAVPRKCSACGVDWTVYGEADKDSNLTVLRWSFGNWRHPHSFEEAWS